MAILNGVLWLVLAVVLEAIADVLWLASRSLAKVAFALMAYVSWLAPVERAE